MKNIRLFLAISIVINLFFVGYYFLKLNPETKFLDEKSNKAQNITKTEDTDIEKKVFSFKNWVGVESYISAIDINNDGVEEIIYQPRSMSWHNTTFILKEDEEWKLVPFCSNCTFVSHASLPEFKDLNGDKLIDIVLPRVVDADETEENVRYNFIGDNYIKVD